RRLEHRTGNVEPGNMAGGTDRLGEGHRRDAGAEADIEHPLARRRRRRPQQLSQHLDVAGLLHRLTRDPARAGNLVPIAPHRGVGSLIFKRVGAAHRSSWTQATAVFLFPFMPGFGPGIHERPQSYLSWMAGPSPAMNE